MKTIITIAASILLFVSATAQVAIGKDNVAGDGILDFKTDSLGLLLPRVITLKSTSVAGTLYFNTGTKKVEYLRLSTPVAPATAVIEAVDLSVKAGTFNVTAEGYDDLNETATLNGTVIGANSSTAPGVLVLESTTKALILPKMANPHLAIKDPAAGMIAYDTTKKCFVCTTEQNGHSGENIKYT